MTRRAYLPIAVSDVHVHGAIDLQKEPQGLEVQRTSKFEVPCRRRSGEGSEVGEGHSHYSK